MLHRMLHFLLMVSIVATIIGVGSNGLAHDDDGVLVSPLDEVTVIDPRVDSEGRPRAIVRDSARGGKIVDIPPAVIVHKYYYTGDRDFQGPLRPGGPSIIVVSHPVSGSRMYVEAQMLPGAPRITYRRDYIDYDFGEKAIRIHFGHLGALGHAGEPTVSYQHGKSLTKKIAEARIKARNGTRHWIVRTGLPHAVRSIGRGAFNVVDATADGIHKVGAIVVSPVTQIIDATPVGSIVHASAEERAIQERDAAVTRAETEAERFSQFIPTNR
jgi:hypothetical protein